MGEWQLFDQPIPDDAKFVVFLDANRRMASKEGATRLAQKSLAYTETTLWLHQAGANSLHRSAAHASQDIPS